MIRNLAIIIGISLMYATPLIYTALGGVVSENAGVVNIGLEGMMTIGAFVGATVGYYVGNPWIAFLAAGVAGGLLALLHAIATVSFTSDHVISGIALNFIGPGMAIFLSRMFFDGAAMTKPIPIDNKIPRSLNRFFVGAETGSFKNILGIIVNQYDTVFLAFILVGVVWFMLYKTKLGLRIRSVGEHPRAADTLGVNVNRVKYFAVILSGVLAGFGGASMSIAVVANYRQTLISGQGFIAMAAMIFGNWTPQGALAACLLFGFAEGLGIYVGSTDLQVSSNLLSMLPYVITLVTLVLFGEGSGGPAANGVPYEKLE